MKLGLNIAHVGVAVNKPCFSVRDHLKPELQQNGCSIFTREELKEKIAVCLRP
jgi:hypothetical protein